MNVKYHVACGIALDLAFGTKGQLTLVSVLPDWPLIINEVRMLIKGEKFDPEKVPTAVFDIYMMNHSLIMCLVVFLIGGVPIGLAYLIHIIADWFTHTGRFSGMPFYPINKYKIKFGKDILK